jgi:hypothetical protein
LEKPSEISSEASDIFARGMSRKSVTTFLGPGDRLTYLLGVVLVIVIVSMLHIPFQHALVLVHTTTPGDDSAATTSRPCVLTFVRYTPSTLETDWAKHAAKLPPPLSDRPFCGDITTPHFLDRMQAWIGIGAHQTANHALTAQDRTEQAGQLRSRGEDVFSRMHYRDSCTDEEVVAHTSPLAGHLRDPRALCQYPGQMWASADWPKERIIPPLLAPEAPRDYQEKDPVILDPYFMARVAATMQAAGIGARPTGHTHRRAFLFDAGASVWSQTDFGGKWPGTRWLFERYRDLGVEFDEIFAWEATAHPGYEYYKGMEPGVMVSRSGCSPGAIPSDTTCLLSLPLISPLLPPLPHPQAKVHFYNYPVSKDPGPQNPLTVLKHVARRGDFVVFKLDIDTPVVEHAILQLLLNDTEAHTLVTHFFFELHYGLKEMQGVWDDNMPGDVLTTAELFVRLRKSGINAQFWP